MVTLGRGATETVKAQISKMGNNLLVLRPGQGWGGGGAPLFSMADVDAIRDQMPGIASVAPFISNNAQVVYQENSRNYDVQGTTPELFRHRELEHRPAAAFSPTRRSRSPRPSASSARPSARNSSARA